MRQELKWHGVVEFVYCVAFGFLTSTHSYAGIKTQTKEKKKKLARILTRTLSW